MSKKLTYREICAALAVSRCREAGMTIRELASQAGHSLSWVRRRLEETRCLREDLRGRKACPAHKV